ncbi:asparagine synthase (glutamine-hydrolyzing) [Pectobacterium parvum]|uniref:asparagine synthase (glutamine-hydrolyzing) n=1 Tax=Pectobacterium parvum TaxID=2778550 RepID=UPI001E4316CC|nr:asparagine synthase (glutamine-hydrolyzing) [Pectobacterium parvum]UFK41100.1 asparagine synthase (glutamine-hydrolyzing) [Pectobacterium parvum]GKW44185.1 asparagine synthetase B [Pectobacterium carotovorum subsp. carotovorum]
MCGLFVAISKSKPFEDIKPFIDATRKMNSRGPDSFNYWSNEYVFLGHTRLAIVDIEGGAQPVKNEDLTLYAVVNGEFYDYIKISKMLDGRGHKLNSASDSEVICHLYEELKGDCVNDLDGMFAIIIFDSANNSIFIARDRLGIKPLVYYENDDHIYFCSSILPIVELLPESHRKINREAVRQFLITGYLPPDSTLVKDVMIFPAATTRLINLNKKSNNHTEFWKPQFVASKETSFSGATMHALLKNEAEKTLPSVPFAIYLSGGIDSSLIYNVVKDHGGKALSLRFDDHFDEGKFQHQVCPETIETTFNRSDYTSGSDQFRQVVIALEQPQIFSLDFPMQLLAATAKDLGCKVALTGDGVDELLGGYDHFQAITVGMAMRRKLTNYAEQQSFLRYLKHLGFPSDYGEKLISLLNTHSEQEEGLGMLLPWSVVWAFSEEASAVVLKDPPPPFWNKQDAYLTRQARTILEQHSESGEFNRFIAFEIKSRLVAWTLWRADKNSMTHAIEVRPPFLTNKMTEFLLTLPESKKKGLYREKLILKWAARGNLPKAIYQRKKFAFNIDNNNFFCKKELQELLAKNSISTYDMFDENGVNLLIEKILQPKSKLYFKDIIEQQTLIGVLSCLILFEHFNIT